MDKASQRTFSFQFQLPTAFKLKFELGHGEWTEIV